ncbi:hypothetical protein PQX77_008079, partial [Marasmius sp. AFHP31]
MLGLQAWRNSLRSVSKSTSLVARYSQQLPPASGELGSSSNSMPKASSPNASPVDVETPPHLDAASALLNDIQNASRMATPETPPVGGNYPKARPPR